MHLRIAFLDRFSAALRVWHTLRVEAGCHQGYGRMCLPLRHLGCGCTISRGSQPHCLFILPICYVD